jgi:CcmD family protein
MEHFGYLFVAYSIIFAAIFLYVVFIWRRQAFLERELDALRKRLDTQNDLNAGEDARSDRPS